VKFKRNIMAVVSNTELKSTILSDKFLNDLIVGRNKKSLKDLRGKIYFRDDYDYKSMRG